MLSRKKSEESFVTLLSSGEEADSRSLYSEETLTDSSIPIFHEKLMSYTRIRELPLVASTLKSELMLYASMKAVESGEAPLFSIQSNKLHFLKKNAPLLTTFRHENAEKNEHCKIYFKILHNNLTCYVFMFRSGRNLVLYNNALKPHCDTVYKDTKLRIYGASGAASTFGNGSLRILLLSQNAASLTDGLDSQMVEKASSIKDINLSRDAGSGPLYDAVVNHKKSEVSHLISEAPTLVPVPFATYIDQGGHKIGGGKLQGYIRIFEAPNGINDDFSEDSLVLSTVLLTLIEQEASKMRGHNKPSYVSTKD